MNLTETLSPFVCLAFIFQLTNLKSTQLSWKKKCREMSSVNIISYFSLALNTEILLSRFFAPCYLFFVYGHIRVENTNNKALTFLFSSQKYTTKRQFRLQIITLREGAAANFKTNRAG